MLALEQMYSCMIVYYFIQTTPLTTISKGSIRHMSIEPVLIGIRYFNTDQLVINDIAIMLVFAIHVNNRTPDVNSQLYFVKHVTKDPILFLSYSISYYYKA